MKLVTSKINNRCAQILVSTAYNEQRVKVSNSMFEAEDFMKSPWEKESQNYLDKNDSSVPLVNECKENSMLKLTSEIPEPLCKLSLLPIDIFVSVI